jgi:pentatricopeptide repeat protein
MLKGCKLVPTIYTYTNLINACVRCFETAKAQEYLDEMKKQGIDPNEVTYTALIKGYCQDGDLKVFPLKRISHAHILSLSLSKLQS